MTAGCTVVACCKKSVSDNGYETKNFPTDAYNAALKKQNPPYWAKHMTREQWDKLQEKKDDYGYGLGNAINSGVNNPGAGVGLYAGSLSTYMVLDEIFTPVLEDYHDLKPGQSHKSDMDAKKLKNLEPLDPAYTESIRIRIARNMKDMPLGTVISKEGRKEVEDKVIKATKAFEGELKGQYYSLESMTEAQQKQLITDHFLFKEGDDHLKHAGLNRDWPHARGIYHNDDKTFLTWVNEEDQLRIISMQKGGDVLKSSHVSRREQPATRNRHNLKHIRVLDLLPVAPPTWALASELRYMSSCLNCRKTKQRWTRLQTSTMCKFAG